VPSGVRRQRHNWLRLPVSVLITAWLFGCASPNRLATLLGEADAEALPARVELTEVAFFPQRRYQCGPAALATVLEPYQPGISAEALVDEVYLPGREGSLQVELLAATQARGLIAYPLDGSLRSALQELAAGRPVLVFQNLGFGWRPYWHYAVLIGFDRDRGTVILRSGTQWRHEIGLRVFERTWARTDRWAFVVADPSDPPVSAEPLPWVRAALQLEAGGHGNAARIAYSAATERWERSPLTWLALGNHRYASGDNPGAIDAYLDALDADPSAHAGWNNLAYLLGTQGCRSAAQRAANCAVSLSPLEATYRRTHAALFSTTPGNGSAAAAHCPVLPACPVEAPGWRGTTPSPGG
jgi:hypothetical protein